MKVAYYGTLRKEEYNHEPYVGPAHKYLYTGVMQGEMYFAFPGAMYPVVTIPLETNSTVIVEVYEVDHNSPEWARVCRLEAGYRPAIAKVWPLHTRDREDMALVWVQADDGFYRGRGDRIPSGDWKGWQELYVELDNKEEDDILEDSV